MAVNFNEQRMYTYIKGFAMGRGWVDTINALAFARELHAGQFRKSGEPYIVHPLTMANHAIALGAQDDAIIAAILLHDVCEDCDVQPAELPVATHVREAVRLLTRVKGEPLKPYYRAISENQIASIAKLFDRCHNVSTMAGVFTLKKLHEYNEETREYVLPLLRKAKDFWPEYSNVLFVLKYHIISVVDGLDACLQAAANKTAANEPPENAGQPSETNETAITASRSIQDRAYEKYQLNWMQTHGHSVKELFRYVFSHHVDGIDPDGGDYESEDVLQLNPDELFDTWARDAGFDGELWSSKDEFLQAEFLDPAYMNTILKYDEYAEYFQAYMQAVQNGQT